MDNEDHFKAAHINPKKSYLKKEAGLYFVGGNKHIPKYSKIDTKLLQKYIGKATVQINLKCYS